MPFRPAKGPSVLLGPAPYRSEFSPGRHSDPPYSVQILDLPPLGDDGVMAAWRELRPTHAGCTGIVAAHPLLGNESFHWGMGRGALPAALVVVGDCPKGEDARLERPFIGDGGAYLHRKLIEVGIDPYDAYYTHAIKCFTPHDQRDAFLKVAVKEPMYREVLVQEIRRARPRVVVCAGQWALKMLLGLDGITKHRGLEQWSEELGCWVVVTYSPEYVLTNSQYDPQVTSDMYKVERRLRGVEPDDSVEVTMCRTVDDVRAALAALDAVPGGVVALDAETKAFLDYRLDSKVWCIALSKDPQHSYLIPLEHPESPFVVGPTDAAGEPVPWDVKAAIKAANAAAHGPGDEKAVKRLDKVPNGRDYVRWLATPWNQIARPELDEVYGLLREWLRDRKVVGHNLKFDARWLRRRFITFHQFFDTQIAAHLLNENRGLKLKERVSTELGFGNWGKGEIEFDPPDTLERMGLYCGKDTAYTFHLYLRDRDDLAADQRVARLFKYAVVPGMEAYLQVEIDGTWVDTVAIDAKLAELRVQLADIHTELLAFVDPVLATQDIAFSGDFLVRWLYDDPPVGLGLPVLKRTPKGAPSTDAKVLEELSERADAPPALLMLLKMRKWERSIVFLESWKNLADEDDRIHPTYNLTGAVSGRRSCNGPNLQQAPREGTLAGIRSCLGAPTGWVLLELDYSQIELRIAAIESGDPVMLEAYRNGRDLHRLTAAAVSGKLGAFVAERGLVGTLVDCTLQVLRDDALYADLMERVTNEERQRAKAINFGFLYGMGYRKFILYAKNQYNVIVSEAEGKAFREMFFALYAALTPWHERRRVGIRRPPFEVESLIGRVRHLPMVLSVANDISSKAERQAINSPVQGLGGDLVLLTTGILYPLFNPPDTPAGERTCFQVGDVHDAVLLQVRADMVMYWASRVKEAMETGLGLARFGFEPEIPLEAELKAGTRWGKLLDWDKWVEAQAA